VNIKPQTVLLTSGQAVTFAAIDAAGQPVAVSWTLNPWNGTLVTPVAPGTPVAPTPVPPAVVSGAPSVTYVAPPLVSAAQTLALIASTATDSASATISLTPDAIAIVPAKVDLKADQSQQFVAIVAAAPGSEGVVTEKVSWILSPPLGTLDPTGLYRAPHEIADSTTLNVIATGATGKLAVAAVNLASPPWQGLGVNVLGGFLLAVFSLVFLMVGLWPPALPSPETAAANRIQAEKTMGDARDKQKADRIEAQRTLSAKKDAAAMQKGNTHVQSSATAGTKTGENASNVEAGNATAADADEDVLQAEDALQVKEAGDDLKRKKDVEDKVNNTDVHTILVHSINRELDLLWLVLLAGTLGSFLHTAQSYSDYVGNRTLKSNWAWWYALRPFIGAGLALVFYAAVRGGFMAITTGTNVKASELNAFGVVSIAALVGMFSKAATTKLGEVFDTLFKSDKATESKDKLVPSSQAASQPASKATTTSAATK
jgi:hypothetical protein